MSLDAPEHVYPAVNKLQELVTTALSNDPDGAGDSPLVAALALTVVQLEQSLVDAKVAVITAANLTLNLRAYVVALERRLYEAGVPIEDTDFDLEPIDDLIEALDELGGH